MTLFEDLVAVLGAEEGAILHAIGRGFKDVESIHYVTGVPLSCVEHKVAALTGLGLLRHSGDGFELCDSRVNEASLASSVPKILVVDDDLDILEFMCNALEAKGFHTISARNGRKAIEVLDEDVKGEVSCVITDFLMPQMNGVELCNALRSKFPRKIAVFLMSAYLEPKVLETIGGFDARFEKPVNFDDLLARISACVPA